MIDIIKNSKLDDTGILTDHMTADAPQYNFGAIREYCRKHQKTLGELSQEEIELFRTN